MNFQLYAYTISYGTFSNFNITSWTKEYNIGTTHLAINTDGIRMKCQFEFFPEENSRDFFLGRFNILFVLF